MTTNADFKGVKNCHSLMYLKDLQKSTTTNSIQQYLSCYWHDFDQSLKLELSWIDFNPLNGDVSDSQLNAGGVSKWPRLKIYLNIFRFTRNLVWLFLIAICTNMQKIRPISQKFTEILRFKNFGLTRFCCTLTYENCRNSLNFWDTKVIFWI